MNFKDYQKKAKETDQNPKAKEPDQNPEIKLGKSEIIPLLGLVGEAGVLLSEYKKKLRDGDKYTGFDDQIKEELGDLLWYISNIATKFKLDLDEIAKKNLDKTRNYFLNTCNSNKELYDKNEKPILQLPREFSYEFKKEEINGKNGVKIMDTETKNFVGEPLNDNSYVDDGYRYHDIMHLTFMAKFGWSPVWRDVLRKASEDANDMKRSNHDVEDGGRSQIIEEAIILLSHVYVQKSSIDSKLLGDIKNLTSKIEVKDRSKREWQDVLIKGFSIWEKLKKNNGGIVTGNLISREISYKKLAS